MSTSSGSEPRNTVTAQELYLLHPQAWTHAQEILAHETSMIGLGVDAEARLEYIQQECLRRQNHAAIAMPEFVDTALADLSRPDALDAFDNMSARFHRYGVSGSIRQLRNIARRTGASPIGLDQNTALGAALVLQNDEALEDALVRAFGPMVNELLHHPDSAAAEAAHDAVGAQRMLLSEKDKQQRQLVLDFIVKVFGERDEFPLGTDRDFAYIRGRLLDVELADILSALVKHSGMDYVAQLMRGSVSAQHEQYCVVLHAVLEPRMNELDDFEETDESDESTTTQEVHADQASEPHTSFMYEPPSAENASPLLSIAETMHILGVSRMTVYRLVTDGALEQIKVRRRSMITRKSLNAYMGSENTV